MVEIGAAYLGFVLADACAREVRVEHAGIVLFTALAAIGLSLSALAVLAAGYLPVRDWPPRPRALMHVYLATLQPPTSFPPHRSP